MPSYRNLSQNEQAVAFGVFQDSINYQNVYIANAYLPFNDGVPVTVMQEEKTPVAVFT